MAKRNRKWALLVEQNGGEYTGVVYVTADRVILAGTKRILADGVWIDFNERIISIEEVL